MSAIFAKAPASLMEAHTSCAQLVANKVDTRQPEFCEGAMIPHVQVAQELKSF